MTRTGHSITLTTVYSSMDKSEIDDLEAGLPKGMLVMDGDYRPQGGDAVGDAKKVKDGEKE